MPEYPITNLEFGASPADKIRTGTVSADHIRATKTSHGLVYIDSEGEWLFIDPYAEPGVNDLLIDEREAEIAARGPERVLKTPEERRAYFLRDVVRTPAPAEDTEGEENA